ncbi:MAG: DUF6119 family protein [Actinomycetota bacterium]
MAARKKVHQLTLALLGEDIENPEEALRAVSDGDFHELRQGLPFRGRLFVRARFGRPPWVGFVETGTTDVIGVASGVRAAAALFVEGADRLFAYLFGYGKSLLRPESIERDFGLKVTLNSVDPLRLRSVDVHTLEELTLHTSRQVSRGSSLDAFGLDVTRDVLRAVAGEPRDRNIARRLVGADMLGFAQQVEFAELGSKCEEMLELFGRTDYRDHFSWVDNLRTVKEDATISRLDEQLIKALQGPKDRQPHLAPPEPIEWIRVEGFTYSTEEADAEPKADLDLDDYLLTLEDPSGVSVGGLKHHRIGVHWSDVSEKEERWTLYDSIVYETEDGEDLYVLTNGRWFRVARIFAEKVKEDVSAIPAADVTVPEAVKGENEREYNQRVADSGVATLTDRSLLRPTRATQPIEFCDLVTPRRQFIHVKKWSRSATLSHLFAQGTVSGETLLGDEGFRVSVREMLKSAGPPYNAVVPTDRPVAADYEIVYAIIGKPGGAATLPFFSQLSLSQAADRLRLLGYKVATKFIAVVDTQNLSTGSG